MVAVGDHGRAREASARAEADLCGDLVADKADHSGGGKDPEVREVLWVDEALDRLVERHAGRDEDREHDGEPGELLAAERAQEERDPEWHRGEGVTEVVDQVREKRDRAREQEDRHLRPGRERQVRRG